MTEPTISDERLDELIMATDMRGRYEPAEYCKRIDDDTAAALRELLRLRSRAGDGVDAARYRWLRTRINWDDVAEQSGELISRYRSWEHRDYRTEPPDSEHIDEYIDAHLTKERT